ncbi:MAG: PEP-CTERM sorting domain-containing protein [Pirellulales bacterium]
MNTSVRILLGVKRLSGQPRVAHKAAVTTGIIPAVAVGTSKQNPTSHNKMKTTARNIVSTLLIALTALAISASVSTANLITNGGFEQGGTGWTLNGDGGFGPGSTWGLTPPNGSNVSVFGAGASWAAGIDSAPFSLTAGQEYTFSFDATGQAAYASNWDSLPWEPGKMGVYYFFFLQGSPNTVLAEGAVYPTAANAWTTTTHTVTAPLSGNAQASAYLYNNGWAGNVANVYVGADNFSVVAVPEPGALALAGIGVAVAAWACRRRRTATDRSAL